MSLTSSIQKHLRKVWPLLSVITFPAMAQVVDPRAVMYEQTSEIGSLLVQYAQDWSAVTDAYSPYGMNERSGNYSRVMAFRSPEQRKRLQETAADYLKKLASVEFNKISIYGKVDYNLLNRKIQANLRELEKENAEYAAVSKYISFADRIYALENIRRRGKRPDAAQVALELNHLAAEVKKDSASYQAIDKIDKSLALTLEKALAGLKDRLASFFTFYNTYDPAFTWSVPASYQELSKALDRYREIAPKKGMASSAQKPDKSGIKGEPIGRDRLIEQLGESMIAYEPGELIELANKEFAWCDREMLKATQELGLGSDWKKALEQVKNSYVPPGQQPELIVKLYNDAMTFIRERDLITIPPLADETWGMIMMSPQRQLVNPFFTGGKEISISYPSSTMQYDDQQMSMRGNNPYFSRGTVQHELIPGHNLQYFMNSRYKSYRREFQTPFALEGWPLYWELLLYEKGFAKTPEERIGMLFWRMHRCARIIFSLNYHLGNWGPQQCIDFLVDRVGHERANAEAEVRRSFEGSYGPLYQLAYLVGGLQYMELKRELVDSGKMTFKQFHDAAMKENLIPVELLRATLLNQDPGRNFKADWKFWKL